MPKLTGVFASFSNLANISAEEVEKYLSSKSELHTLENFIANRVLYPQSIPMNKIELDMDLAILKALVSLEPEKVYSFVKQTLTIPEEWVARFPSLEELVVSLMEVVPLGKVTRVMLKTRLGSTQLGSVIHLSGIEGTVKVRLGSKEVKLKGHTVTLLKLLQREVEVSLNGVSLPAFGGKLGVIVNLI